MKDFVSSIKKHIAGFVFSKKLDNEAARNISKKFRFSTTLIIVLLTLVGGAAIVMSVYLIDEIKLIRQKPLKSSLAFQEITLDLKEMSDHIYVLLDETMYGKKDQQSSMTYYLIDKIQKRANNQVSNITNENYSNYLQNCLNKLNKLKKEILKYEADVITFVKDLEKTKGAIITNTEEGSDQEETIQASPESENFTNFAIEEERKKLEIKKEIISQKITKLLRDIQALNLSIITDVDQNLESFEDLLTMIIRLFVDALLGVMVLLIIFSFRTFRDMKKLFHEIVDNENKRESISNYLNQGIMTFNEKGIVDAGANSIVRDYFGEDPAGKKFHELLKLKAVELNNMLSWYESVFWGDNDDFEESLVLVPKTVGDFDLTFKAIYDDEEDVDRILCIMSRTTNIAEMPKPQAPQKEAPKPEKSDDLPPDLPPIPPKS